MLGPITRGGKGWTGGFGGSGEGGKGERTNLIRGGADKISGGLQALIVEVCGLLGGVVGGAELDVGVVEVVFYSVAMAFRE